jgi:hypothetical protein
VHLGVVIREEVVSAAEYDRVATLLTEGAQMNLVVHTVLTILTLRQYRGPVPNGGKQTL